MIIATFNSATGWAGKSIAYDDGVFTLEGHGTISARDVLSYDEGGHIEWAYDGLREWYPSERLASTSCPPASPQARSPDLHCLPFAIPRWGERFSPAMTNLAPSRIALMDGSYNVSSDGRGALDSPQSVVKRARSNAKPVGDSEPGGRILPNSRGQVGQVRGHQELEHRSPARSTQRRLARSYSRLLRHLARPLMERLDATLAAQYEQVEALVALYVTLDIPRPLPPLRGSAVSPDFARELVLMVMDTQPATILELGSGASTVVAGYALRKSGAGRIVSLEHDAHWFEKSSALVRAHGLDDVATVVHAPLRAHDIAAVQWMWYDTAAVDQLGPIDLLIVDGPPFTVQTDRYPALPLLYKHLSSAAVIMLDDANRPEETEIVRRWTQEFGPFSVDNLETEKGLCVLRSQDRVPADRLASR